MEVNLPFHTWKHNNWVNSFTIDQINKINPSITYDIGIGDGFYGQLLKYLKSTSKIIGVELNPKWVEHCTKLNIYDEIHYVDTYAFLSNDVTGDLIIFGDILEHLEKPQMGITLNNAVNKFKWVLINGPIGFQPQEHIDKEEIHRCGVTKEEDLSIYEIVEYNEIPNHMMNCLIKGNKG